MNICAWKSVVNDVESVGDNDFGVVKLRKKKILGKNSIDDLKQNMRFY